MGIWNLLYARLAKAQASLHIRPEPAYSRSLVSSLLTHTHAYAHTEKMKAQIKYSMLDMHSPAG